MNYTISAVIFSGLPLFFNGYTIRYINLSKIIRKFYKDSHEDENIQLQVSLLRKRLYYIKWIQLSSVFSLIFATLSFFIGFFGIKNLSHIAFFMSILTFLLSLIISAVDLYSSTKALNKSLEIGGQ